MPRRVARSMVEVAAQALLLRGIDVATSTTSDVASASDGDRRRVRDAVALALLDALEGAGVVRHLEPHGDSSLRRGRNGWRHR